MPLATLHLVRLAPDVSPSGFARRLASGPPRADISLLTASLVRSPVIRAQALDSVLLNSTPWSLLLVFVHKPLANTDDASSADVEPFRLAHHAPTSRDVVEEYVVYSGVPSKIVNSYHSRTKELNGKPKPKLLNTSSQARTDEGSPRAPPPTSQNLEPSKELDGLVAKLDDMGWGDKPVQQLNLLAFKKGKEDTERYHAYGQAFNKVASPHGGTPKLLGLVVKPPSNRSGLHPDSRGDPEKRKEEWWDEISLVHYPSLRHFADMSASEAYQKINRELRLPSLRDTTIICTQELDLESAPGRSGAKL